MEVMKIFDKSNTPKVEVEQRILNFLYENLGEYGDEIKDIQKAIDYALGKVDSFGGFILAYYEGLELLGVVVVNKTGMKGYIPENILVYIASHKKNRGKGIGKKLINRTIEESSGNIALHVEKDNPAKDLYEKLGFTPKYIEMRLDKKGL